MSDEFDWAFGTLADGDAELAYQLTDLKSAVFRLQMEGHKVDVVIADGRVTDSRQTKKKLAGFTDLPFELFGNLCRQ